MCLNGVANNAWIQRKIRQWLANGINWHGRADACAEHHGKPCRRGMLGSLIIHLKTDSDFLYTYTDIMVKENKFEVIENISDIYAQEEVSELLQIKTHYELQWLGRGKLIKYLAFRPHRNDFIEPEVEIEPDDYRSYGRDRREQVVNALKENENI